MVMYKLIAEISGDILHVGTKAECQMILDAMVVYGIREDKLLIEEAI